MRFHEPFSTRSGEATYRTFDGSDVAGIRIALVCGS